MIPLIASPCPSNSGLAFIFERARWPQTTPAIAATINKPQQNPQIAIPLKTSDMMASGSVFLCGANVIGTPGAGAGEICGALLETDAVLTPGTVERAAQPAAPSYHAWSDRLRVPAASCRLISSSEKIPSCFPSRAT